MGKWIVWAWVFVLVATLVGMQAALFGTKGLPRFLGGSGHVPVATPAQPEKKPEATPAAPPSSRMVQPESLPQGFIVLVTDKTNKANASSPIYMPSSHNGWNPADPKMQLTAQSDGKWRIMWEKPTLDSRIAFKFARGSWDAVETKADFKDIDNRMLPMIDASKIKPGEKPMIELEIVAWHDQMPGSAASGGASDRYRPIKVSIGHLQRVEVIGGANASTARDLLVWIPPGYNALENRQTKYSVLYLMDGQNVFEKTPPAPGSWEAAETAAKLMADGKIAPLIIVAIPNAGTGRSQEYLPFEMIDNVTPRGKEFVSFLTGEVMPRIERLYRVRTDAEGTGIGGASLGAVIALEAATQNPDKFGKVLCESMPLTNHERAAFKYFGNAKAWPGKIAFGMGGKEFGSDEKNAAKNLQLTDTAAAFKDLAQGKGLGAEKFRLTIDQDAEHNEVAWAKRFGPALEFLFPAK